VQAEKTNIKIWSCRFAAEKKLTGRVDIAMNEGDHRFHPIPWAILENVRFAQNIVLGLRMA
jgi:hypothetical protein